MRRAGVQRSSSNVGKETNQPPYNSKDSICGAHWPRIWQIRFDCVYVISFWPLELINFLSTHFAWSVRTVSVWLVPAFGFTWCEIKLKICGRGHRDKLMSKPGFYNSKWSLYRVVSGEVHSNDGLVKGFSSFYTCTKFFGANYEKIYPQILYNLKNTDDNNLFFYRLLANTKNEHWSSQIPIGTRFTEPVRKLI